MLTSCLNVIVIVAIYNLETICTSDLCTLVSKECTPGLLSLSVYIVVLNYIQSDISITRNSGVRSGIEMAVSLDVPLPEITTEEFERSWTRFKLVAAAKKWDAAKQLAIVPHCYAENSWTTMST